MHGLAFAFAALIAFTAFDGTWRHPYRQAPLAADTVGVGLSGPLNGLSTDAVTASVPRQQVRAAADAVAGARRRRRTVVVWTPGPPRGLGGHAVSASRSSRGCRPTTSPSSRSRPACEDHSRGILLAPEPRTSPATVTTDPVARRRVRRSQLDAAAARSTRRALPVDDLIPSGLAVSYAAAAIG